VREDRAAPRLGRRGGHAPGAEDHHRLRARARALARRARQARRGGEGVLAGAARAREERRSDPQGGDQVEGQLAPAITSRKAARNSRFSSGVPTVTRKQPLSAPGRSRLRTRIERAYRPLHTRGASATRSTNRFAEEGNTS